ncbi:MAG: acetyl-CoA C-acyltransferase [Yaniella sp.]|nr:acetyl-CoA C-acyltransferase [Yaniella sp.]
MVAEAFLVSGKRTPVGRHSGVLSSLRPDDMAATAIKAVLGDSGLDSAVVDEVLLGNANGAGEENRNVARMAWLLAGGDESVPAMTVNRLCSSGMSAIETASRMVATGDADIVIAGGVESMSRAPWVLEKPTRAFAQPGQIFDSALGWRFVNPRFEYGDLSRDGKMTYSMTETAQEVANIDGVTRQEADEFAAASQAKAVAATEAGHFANEIVPVEIKDRKGNVTVVDQDEGPRPGTTAEKLRNLRPVTGLGDVVTAGNSSSLNDGASAIIVASAAAVEKYNLTPRARIVAGGSAGLAPEVMGLGPVPATEKVLARAGWSVDDLDAAELNEAFATQSIASMRRLGIKPEIVNAWGGAIALGHPLGSSGSRIVITLLSRLEAEEKSRGLATMCVGVGQGAAMLIERV